MPLAVSRWKGSILALSSLALVAAVPTVASAAQSKRTAVIFVSPFTKDHTLKRSDVITETAHGECLGASPIGGSDTSECLVTGSTSGYALCWSALQKPAKYALCSNDISSHDYVKVLVNKPPVVFSNVKLIWPSRHQAAPVTVRLSAGEVCSETPGSPDNYQGRPVFYSCHNSNLGLLSYADTNRPTWTFASVTFANGRYAPGSRVSVSTAWFPD